MPTHKTLLRHPSSSLVNHWAVQGLYICIQKLHSSSWSSSSILVRWEYDILYFYATLGSASNGEPPYASVVHLVNCGNNHLFLTFYSLLVKQSLSEHSLCDLCIPGHSFGFIGDEVLQSVFRLRGALTMRIYQMERYLPCPISSTIIENLFDLGWGLAQPRCLTHCCLFPLVWSSRPHQI